MPLSKYEALLTIKFTNLIKFISNLANMKTRHTALNRKKKLLYRTLYLATIISISTISNPNHAALFDPGTETIFTNHVEISNSPDSIGDLIGIELSGNATHPSLTFTEGVDIDISRDTEDIWNGYGVWASSSINGPAFININNTTINIQGTTNIGIGIISNTDFIPTGGAQPEDQGTTVTLSGNTNVTMNGNSVIGLVAGSAFNNNTNGGGQVILDQGDHIFNITSNWKNGYNSDKDSDWAVGLLAYDEGKIIQNGDVKINLSVSDMLNTGTAWADFASGIYVDNNSIYTQNKNSNLYIKTQSVNSDAAPSRENFVNIAGISAGLTLPQDNESTQINLSGTTTIEIGLSNQSAESATAGLLVVGGAQATIDGSLTIRMLAPEDSVDSYGDFVWNGYGIAAGTWVPGSTLGSTGYGGSVEVTGALTILPPSNYSPALTNFVALYSNGTRGTAGNYGGITIDNSISLAPVNIVGFVQTEKNGNINLNLVGTNASWIGAADSETFLGLDKIADGKISVSLSNGASWTVLDVIERDKDYWSNDGESQVYDIILNNGGILNLQTPSLSDLANYIPRTEYQSVKIWNNLSGNQGIIAFDMDLINESKDNVLTDQVIIATKLLALIMFL